MSNELNNIVSMNTDGVFEGVAIGGDRYGEFYYMGKAIYEKDAQEMYQMQMMYFNSNSRWISISRTMSFAKKNRDSNK